MGVYDRATFMGAHLARCAECNREVISARASDGAFVEVEPVALRLDVHGAVMVDRLELSTWQLDGTVLESVRGLVHGPGWVRGSGCSLHLGHVCSRGPVGPPAEWFDPGFPVVLQRELFDV